MDYTKRQLEILQELTKNQAKINENQLRMDKSLAKMKQQFEDINRNMKENNKLLEKTNETIGNSNTIIDGIKDTIKEFAIYASNRDDADKHLRDNMDLLAQMWQNSISLFTETKDLIDDIHSYSEVINTERTRILSNIPSDKYQGLQVSIMEEWLLDMMIEMIKDLSYKPVTVNKISKWLQAYISKYISEHGYDKMPKFLDLDDQVEFATLLHNSIQEEFDTTDFFTILYWSLLIPYQCIHVGAKFVDHPMVSIVIDKSTSLEAMLYE